MTWAENGASRQAGDANRSAALGHSGHTEVESSHGGRPTNPSGERRWTNTQTPTGHARRPSGRDAKRASRAARAASSIPYITRKIPYYEVLSEEGLATLEYNADTILEEIGIDFRDDPEALEIWKAAGADVQGERVHFARGMCRALVQTHRAARIHAACAQPGAQRGHRRQEHRFRARLRLAVRAQPR